MINLQLVYVNKTNSFIITLILLSYCIYLIMNHNVEETVKRLSFENFIWIGFVIVSLLDIYGDELIKKGLIENDRASLSKANKLFLGLAYFSILVYLYFLIRNYYDYKKYRNKNYQIRLLGSILILAGTLCLVYFQKNNKTPVDSSSNV